METSQTENKPGFQLFVLLSLSLIWGSSFILIKKGLMAFDPVQAGTIRIVVASSVLLPVALKNFKIFKGDWKRIFALGIIAYLLPAILFSTAETNLSSSLAGILNSLTPIFTLIVGVAAFKTGINKGQIVGLMIGLLGSVGLSFIDSGGGLGKFNYYALFVIAATLCYGISGNMVKSYFMHINSLKLTALAMFAVGPFALVYLLSTDFIFLLKTDSTAWESLGYLFLLGTFGSAVALVMFNKLIQMTSAVFASTVTYLIPIVAVIWGIIDGENLYAMHFVGMAVIIFGVYIVNKYKY